MKCILWAEHTDSQGAQACPEIIPIASSPDARQTRSPRGTTEAHDARAAGAGADARRTAPLDVVDVDLLQRAKLPQPDASRPGAVPDPMGTFRVE